MGLLKVSELERVYERHRHEIKAFLRSACGDSEEAEDLLHAVFERLIQLTAEGRVRQDTIRPFLYRLARNLQVDAHRSRGAEERRLRMAAPPEAVHEDRDHSGRILAVVARGCRDPALTERQRTILNMRFLRRLEIKEIESALRISHNGLYRELEKIRLYLREAFAQAGLTPAELEEPE